ncbi:MULTISPECIES: DUF397 domain-containing protein [Kitasatospora]|uniref:DUF397 domain-containing protein n=1 Tax=Kitasatospora setae (strain ATCC 33774 / DSM 43861 / JCM 3304 / KCC A-0304 / NBRC 14216 / KM-6054) TaxID=452652 RepID=E4N7D3_KITSK|nr:MULTISPECIES: DUF397 domain-containing protein [Kitasatospora]BAJ27114.1 hypothetical protein KSE_12830 [Kitasatospora setae KM-6054]
MGRTDEHYNGMPAAAIQSPHPAQKAVKSQGLGECVMMQRLPDGRVAVFHQKDATGPALVFTRAEVDAWLDGAKKEEFDHLLG